MDTSQYLEIFLDETKEHLQNLNTQILELEQEPENMDTINEIFRAAHSLKGMAGTMGYKRMQNLTHDMENVFSEVRNGTIKVQPEMIDILFNCLDALEEYLANIQQTTEEGTNDNEELIKALNDMLNKEEKEAQAAKGAPAQGKTATEAPASSDGNSKEKWREIKLNDTELMLVIDSKEINEQLGGAMQTYEHSARKANADGTYDNPYNVQPVELTPKRERRMKLIKNFLLWTRYLF